MMRAWQIAVDTGGFIPTTYYFTDKERAKRTAKGMAMVSGCKVSFNLVNVKAERKVFKGARLDKTTRKR